MTFCQWIPLGDKNQVWNLRGAAIVIERAQVPEQICFIQSEQDILAPVFQESIKSFISNSDVTIKFIGLSSIASCLQVLKFSKVILRENSFQLMYDLARKKLQVSAELETIKIESAQASIKQQKTKVLIVDDSKTIRNILTKIFSADPELEVIGAIDNPLAVEDFLKVHKPDVMTLDIHMPEMDGVTLLKRLMPQFHIPTVMISSISKEEGPQVLAALEAGAVDYIQKPSFKDLDEASQLIVQSIKTAATARLQRKKLKKEKIKAVSIDNSKVVLIGSSTGGTEALREIFENLPSEIPPILVVQHIPSVFSLALAERLNSLCPFVVKEAQQGDLVLKNQVLIAPGGKQMGLRESGRGLYVEITDDAPVNRHRPSVDFLFDSACAIKGIDWVAAVLTGMGADGAKGLFRLRQLGARTIGQDEQSSVVYGMPREAARLGGVEFVLPLGQVAEKIVELTANKKLFKKIG